ncbi:MAG TPA: ABC transporter substrate-binding protein [Candidatus Binatia bacterium]|jgi:ABC-type nitrate/sulfonate/bicarbonate transport system substrate-binding protein
MILVFHSVGRMSDAAPRARLCGYATTIVVCCFLIMTAITAPAQAQGKKVRVALPGYTIAALSFLAAKVNNYYAAEGLDVELIAMRAPTANLAVLSGSVEFSGVPLAGLTTALKGAPLRVLFCQFDKPQHVLYARPELQNVRALQGKKLAVAGVGVIDDILLREVLNANGLAPARDVTILAVGAADTRFTALMTGAIDASVLIAPVTFSAREQGFRELIVFKDQGFVLPSGGIVAREELIKTDSAMVEKFVRATVMGFLFMRENRPGTLKVMARVLKIDDLAAARLYDSSRPTMTADGTISAEAAKKMTGFILKIAGMKEAPPADKLFEFVFVRKAHGALQAKSWQPIP